GGEEIRRRTLWARFRGFALWLNAYNKALMRLDQKGRGITLYEKLSQHPSGRIRAIAAEQRLDLENK
ncbi:MAG: hypothetical protein ACKO2X_09735, partial [Bacteroidota bacterium]